MTLYILASIICCICGAEYYFRHIQTKNSIARNYGMLGILREMFENQGDKLRQYFFHSDTEGKPMSRYAYEHIVMLGKYLKAIRSWGSRRDFSKAGFIVNDAVFVTPDSELAVDNSRTFETMVYEITSENFGIRQETHKPKTIAPWHLAAPIIIGKNDPLVTVPMIVRSIDNVSDMSFGSLGENATQTIARGSTFAGCFVKSGEGGISDYHLVGDNNVIFQMGPGNFGCRHDDGSFDREAYIELMKHGRITATDIKFHQGAKIKGGVLLKEKITEYIAKIRKIPMGKDCLSPNRSPNFHNNETLGNFINQCKIDSGKPVGMKIVVGNQQELYNTLKALRDMKALPNFIHVDGGEGGTGAANQDMSDALGLPTFRGLAVLTSILKDLGIKEKITVIASGGLFTPDLMVYALCLGADIICSARGIMVNLGCIMALKCHTNECPAGVATQDPKRQKGLVISEKHFRVANGICGSNEAIFKQAGACGLRSPRAFTPAHISYIYDGGIMTGEEYIKSQCTYKKL